MPKFVKLGGSSTKWNTRTVEERIRKIESLIHRPIRWDIIRRFSVKGEIRRCEICGEEESGGFWCRPCIHRTWCCICCILLGIPNYEVGLWVLTTEEEASNG